MPDPDREELVPVGGLQQNDRLLADQVEADAVDEHLLHPRPWSEYSSGHLGETRIHRTLGGVQPAVTAHWLEDIEAFEAISQDAETRRIFLRMSALSKGGSIPRFLEELAHDRGLDDETKDQLLEIASDRTFLLAVEEYMRRTQRVH
jgi:hypothetical protein